MANVLRTVESEMDVRMDVVINYYLRIALYPYYQQLIEIDIGR